MTNNYDDMCHDCGSVLTGPAGETECPECDEAAFAPFEETNAKIRRLEEENTQLRSLATDFVKWAQEIAILMKEDQVIGDTLIKRARKVIKE
jgi:uncharacterized Zn finger protein (UPF0148 family)